MSNESEFLLPDAFHVGFSKCASTFLQAYFGSHPQIHLVNQSHYLAPFSFSAFPNERAAYLELFRDAEPHQVKLESDEHILLPLFHPILGAAATTLDSVREVSRRIYSVQPQAKIIIVVRNQTSLIVSRYSEYIICGGTYGFDEFVSEFLRCSQDGINYYQNYYAEILRIFRNDFTHDRVLLLLQEELARDEQGTIRRLGEFLQVASRPPADRGVITRRVGLSRTGVSTMRAFNRLVVKQQKQSFREVQARIPFLAYKVLQRSLRMLDYFLLKRINPGKAAILSAEVEARIRAEFHEDNTQLAKMLGRNLLEFGY